MVEERKRTTRRIHQSAALVMVLMLLSLLLGGPVAAGEDKLCDIWVRDFTAVHVYLEVEPDSLAWNPVYDQIALGWHSPNPSRVYVLDSVTGETVRENLSLEHSVESVSWSSDGINLVASSLFAPARIINSRSGETVHTFSAYPNDAKSVAWSHDGMKIAATASDSNMTRYVVVWAAQTGEEIWRQEQVNRSWQIRFSPSDEWLASSAIFSHIGDPRDTTIKIWNSTTGELAWILSGHEDHVVDFSWSHDSTRLVSSSNDGSVRIWDVPAEEEVWREETDEKAIVVDWSPDGSKIAVGLLRTHESKHEPVIEVINSSSMLTETRITLPLWGDEYAALRWSPAGDKLAFATDFVYVLGYCAQSESMPVLPIAVVSIMILIVAIVVVTSLRGRRVDEDVERKKK